jgi:hypothetical protein
MTKSSPYITFATLCLLIRVPVLMGLPFRAPRFTLRVALAAMAIVAVIGWGMGKGPPSDGVLWIATNLQDVLAEIFAEVYRQR